MPPSRPNFPVHSRMRVCWLMSVLSRPAKRSSVSTFSPTRSGVARLTLMEYWALSRAEAAAARAWVMVTRKRVGSRAPISETIKLLTTNLRFLTLIQNLYIGNCSFVLATIWYWITSENRAHMRCKCHNFLFYLLCNLSVERHSWPSSDFGRFRWTKYHSVSQPCTGSELRAAINWSLELREAILSPNPRAVNHIQLKTSTT